MPGKVTIAILAWVVFTVVRGWEMDSEDYYYGPAEITMKPERPLPAAPKKKGTPRPLGKPLEIFPKDCDRVYSCVNCTTARICKRSPGGEGWVEVQRELCGPDRPFCEPRSGICVSETPPACGMLDNSFMCAREGTFPDPTDCTKFHICSEHTSKAYFCRQGETFDAVKRKCSRSAPCHTSYCRALSGLKSPFSNTEYFTYCLNEKPVMIDKCEAGKRLNFSSQQCESYEDWTARCEWLVVCHYNEDQDCMIVEHDFFCPSYRNSKLCLPKDVMRLNEEFQCNMVFIFSGES